MLENAMILLDSPADSLSVTLTTPQCVFPNQAHYSKLRLQGYRPAASPGMTGGLERQSNRKIAP